MAEQKKDTTTTTTARYNFSFGYLARGDNIEVKEMTINEALDYAIKLGPECTGFTCEAEGDYNKKVNIWFKKDETAVYKVKEKEWQSYVKPQYRVCTGFLRQGYNLEVNMFNMFFTIQVVCDMRFGVDSIQNCTITYIQIKEMTINEAKGYALLLPRCSGFTFKKETDLNKKITIWFKEDITEVYNDDEWTSYTF